MHKCEFLGLTVQNLDCEPGSRRAFNIKINTNCPGHNGQPINIFGQDHRKCEELCLQQDQCIGFVWQGWSETSSRCWLKTEMRNCREVDGGKCGNGTCFAGFIDQNTCKGKI